MYLLNFCLLLKFLFCKQYLLLACLLLDNLECHSSDPLKYVVPSGLQADE